MPPGAPSDVLATSRLVVDTLSAVPVPVLAPIMAAVTKIITEVEKVQVLKESCTILAERAKELVANIAHELQSSGDLQEAALQSISSLERIILEIAELMQVYAGMPWYRLFFKQFTLNTEVMVYTARLDDAFKVFQMQAAVRVESSQTKLCREVARATVSIHRAVTDTAEVIRMPVEDVFMHGQITAVKSRSANSWRFLHGRIDLGTLDTGTLVIWKKYNRGEKAAHEFQRERGIWKVLSHPSLIQFMGCSAEGSDAPFLVFTGGLHPHSVVVALLMSANLAHRVELSHKLPQKLASEFPCASFLTALQVLQTIASTSLYLGSTFRLRVQEMEACMNVSNILIDPDDNVILGRNIVEEAPQLPLENPGKQVERLFGLFYPVAEEVLFFKKPVFPFTSWSAVGETRPLSHLRPLLRFAAWDPLTNLTTAERRLTDLTDRLQAIPIESLDFPQIRKAVLSMDNVLHSMVFRPQNRWSVELFDIGYVRNEEFIPLCNAHDTFGAILPVGSEQEIATLPILPPEDIKTLPGGIVQFKFTDVNFAAVHRCLNSRRLADSALATYLLMDVSRDVLHEYGSSHQIRLSELIIVTGIMDHPSGARISFPENTHGDTRTRPKTFYFYALPPGSRPWGYWSTADTPADTLDSVSAEGIKGATITTVTEAQMIDFVQLQEEDAEVDAGPYLESTDGYLSLIRK